MASLLLYHSDKMLSKYQAYLFTTIIHLVIRKYFVNIFSTNKLPLLIFFYPGSSIFTFCYKSSSDKSFHVFPCIVDLVDHIVIVIMYCLSLIFCNSMKIPLAVRQQAFNPTCVNLTFQKSGDFQYFFEHVLLYVFIPYN